MVATALAIQTVARAGLDPVFTAANVDGHTIVNTLGNVALYVKNGGGAPINVTFATPGTVDGLAVADRVVAVPAAGERVCGPFPTSQYGTSLTVTFSAVTSVTVAALKV